MRSERTDMSASLEKEWYFVKETQPAHIVCGEILCGGNFRNASVEQRREDAAMGGFDQSDDLAILHVNNAVGLGGEFVVMSHDHEGGTACFVQGAHQSE